MAHTPTPAPVDHFLLKNLKFQEFCHKVPHADLAARHISLASFNAVTFMLSRHGTFKDGTGIRISQAGLADESGVDHRTVKKVTDFLKATGALECIDLQRRQGSPSENYRFRLSTYVAQVLKRVDRGPKASTRKRSSANIQDGRDADLDGRDADLDGRDASLRGRDANNKKIKNDKEGVIAPSSLPPLSPTARGERREEETHTDMEKEEPSSVWDAFGDADLDALLSTL